MLRCKKLPLEMDAPLAEGGDITINESSGKDI
jgi:hypothetical protein